MKHKHFFLAILILLASNQAFTQVAVIDSLFGTKWV